MSIRKLARSFCVFGVCALQSGAASADTPTVAMAKSNSSNRGQVAQTAQLPAKPVSAASMQVGAVPGAAAPATLWSFMGIPQGWQKLRGATANRNGNLPGREPKPALKAIADPANLQSQNPAIKTAAQIKQQEDLKKQKIKALKYLATIGCGCYAGVKEAFMDALDDCTEDVRLQAAESIAKAADTKCAKCSKTCCCDADMMQKLNDVATARDDDGCFKEPSAAVREAACEALMACRRRVRVYPAPVVPGPPIDGEIREPVPDTMPNRETVPDMPIPPSETSNSGPSDLIGEILGIPGSRPTGVAKKGLPATSVSARSASKSKAPTGDLTGVRSVRVTKELLTGSIVGVDMKTTTVDIEFEGPRQPTVGSQFSVEHDYAFSTRNLGRLEVVYPAGSGRAICRPTGRTDITKLGKGDRVSGRIVVEEEPATINVSTKTKLHAIHSSVAPVSKEVPNGSQRPSDADQTRAGGGRVRSLLASFIRFDEEETAGPEFTVQAHNETLNSPQAPAVDQLDAPDLKVQSAHKAQASKPSSDGQHVAKVDDSRLDAKRETISAGTRPAVGRATPGIILLED
jgi:hypothetical protein